MIKHIFLDFNGTLLDDLDLCLDLLNWMLKDQNKPIVKKNKYKNIFTFPVKNYYIKAGLDFNIESFESLAHKFMNQYVIRYKECKLFDGVLDTLDYLKKKGYKTYILSASKQSILNEQCEYFGLTKYFDEIIGVSDIYASSKEKIAVRFIEENDINVDEAIFIGDTLHDEEVARTMGIKCYLVECGHQSYNVLSEAGVKIIKNINELKGEF